MRHRCFTFLGLVVLVAGMLAMGGPVRSGKRADSVKPAPRLVSSDFRCIVVGDSQTTGPNSDRMRTQNHRWDAPIVGELVTIGNTASGFLVNNSNANISNLSFQYRNIDFGWPDGGPNDFFATLASHWGCSGDIVAPGSQIGRYRVRFHGNNTEAPWNEDWGIGNRLVARIAVRTSPMSVDAVETRPERGGVRGFADRRIHKLKKTWGVQVIEQPIPVDINPSGDDVGVGLYFPAGSVEKAGQVLQVLGVVIVRVDSSDRTLPGTIVGYQGNGGWNIQDHLDKLTPASRVALIEMVEAEYVMIMLGHNGEQGGASSIRPNLEELVGQWEAAFALSGRERPQIIYVVPWVIIFETVSTYLLELESVMESLALMNRQDISVNYLSRFNYQRPDIYQPKNYQLDGARVHPGDVPTAVNLAIDLFQMLFHPNDDP